MAFALLKIWKRCYLKKHILISAKTANNARHVIPNKNYFAMSVLKNGHYNL